MHSQGWWARLFAVLVVAVCCAHAAGAADDQAPPGGEEVNDARAAYDAMWACRFEVTPRPLSGAPVTLSAGPLELVLTSGSVRALEPVAGGRVNAYLFVGEGELHARIVNDVEAAQLVRFTDRPKTTLFREPVTSALVVTSRDLRAELGAPPGDDGLELDKEARKRLEIWLRVARADLFARVAAGLETPNDDYLFADVETADFGRLTIEHDLWSEEPDSLLRLDEGRRYVEAWLSFPAPAGSSWMPSQERVDLVAIDADIDLRGYTARENARSGVNRDWIRLRTTIRLRPGVGGATALGLELGPRARVTAVRRQGGPELDFVQAQIGKRFASIDNDVVDSDLVVFLDASLEAGVEQELEVAYEMKTQNYASGLAWYPHLPDSINDLHTATMTFHYDRGVEVRAIGRLVREQSSDEGKTSVWEVDRPTRMVGFSFGRGYDEEKLTIEGVPEVVVFGRRSGATTGNMLRNVAVDIAKSLHFFQWYLDTKIPVERVYVTRIAAGHGQSFDGFIQLSRYTFDAESPGASELFRAHEAAHQFWGHLVGWKSSRDQWLSEALAEYSAMLFVQATMADKGFFEEILDVYTNEQLGSLSKAMSKFARPWLGALRFNDVRDELGPIGIGYRASTARVPYGYQVQVYNKGALVLHMLRGLLNVRTGGEDVFRAVLTDFVHTYAGKAAGTEDFERVVARHAPGDWSWFFDEWIGGTEIPTLTWSYDVASRPNADGGYELEITVHREGVGEGFVVPVPVEIQYGGGAAGRLMLPVKQDSETFKVVLPRRPKRLVFDPDHAVLARVKEGKKGRGTS